MSTDHHSTEQHKACPKCFFENPINASNCEFCGWQLLDEQGEETVFMGAALDNDLLQQEDDQATVFQEMTEFESALDNSHPDLTHLPTAVVTESESLSDEVTQFQEYSEHQADNEQPAKPKAFNLAGNLAHFEVQQIIGKGGMGAVYKAQDQTLERHVAIKVLRQHKGLDQAGKDLLLEEARTICKLNHPNIVTVFDIARGKDNNFIIMEWIDGQTLDKLLPNDGLDLDTALNYARQIVQGLAHAHQHQIIHSDIKPQNIMLTQNEVIKILDFGIAGLMNKQSLQLQDDSNTQHKVQDKTKGFTGTPGYVSPEQALGKKQLDERSDIFAFGIVFYQLLTGIRPFEGKNAKEKNAAIITGDYRSLPAKIPQDIRAIVEQCLKLSPKDRYQTSVQLADDLQRYQNGNPVSVINSKRYWLKKKAVKHRWPVLLVTLAMLGGVGQLTWQQIQAGRQAEREQLLTRFTSRVETLEAKVQMSKMAPIHDTSAELQQWHQEISVLKTEIGLLGDIALGPGNNAIGRMYYALQEYDTALQHLQTAWSSGFTDSEVAYNLALTHGAIYQRQKAIIANLSSRSARKDRMAVLDAAHKQPAINYLTQGMQGSPYQSYTRALLEYYQGEYDTALEILSNTSDLPVWFYQHHVLAGDIYLAKAEEAGGSHGDDAVENNGQLALENYQRAASLGRSDLQLQLKPLAVYFRLLSDALYGEQSEFNQIYQTAMTFVDNSENIAPRDYQPYFIKGQLLSRKSAFEDQSSGDPIKTQDEAIAVLDKALELSENNADILYSLGRAYFQKIKLLQDREYPVGGEFEAAIEIFEQIPKQERDYFFYNTYANILQFLAIDSEIDLSKNKMLYQGRIPSKETDSNQNNYFKRSIDNYQQAIKLQPNRIGAKINLAITHMEWSTHTSSEVGAEKLANAIDELNKALFLNPDHFVVNYYLGATHRWLAKLNNLLHVENDKVIEQADNFFKKADQSQPNHPFLISEQAMLLAEKSIYAWQIGKSHSNYFGIAKELLAKSQKENPNNGLLQDNMALVYRLEQQISFFHYGIIKNKQELNLALNKSDNRESDIREYGLEGYYLLTLLEGDWRSITKQDIDSLPVNTEAILVRGEWYSQAGKFDEAEYYFKQISQYYPSLLWLYRLQHYNRWLDKVSDTQKKQWIQEQIKKVKSDIKEYYPALSKNL